MGRSAVLRLLVFACCLLLPSCLVVTCRIP